MHSKREKKEKPVSVLEGDEKFLKKILSRDSSVGYVSQHYRSAGEVPFQWETMPGTPRNSSSGDNAIRAGFDEEYEGEETDIRAVMSPPPGPLKKAPQSCFWRKNMWKRSKKFHQGNKSNNNNINGGFDGCGSYKFSNGDDAYNCRPCASNSSSPSSSSSYSSTFLTFADDDHGTSHSSSSSSTLKGLARKVVSWAF